MSLSPGTRLGVYEIAALIGAGGMGEVYRARDPRLNRDVALKVLPEALALDPDRLARFKREAQVLASLNHPNIAAIYGFEEGALVLELVEGPTLADRIAEGPLPLDDALPIARQIVDAIEAAHEHGVIHRDLKPANIKLRPDGTVKVLDFGLAKAMDPDAAGVGAGSRIDVTASPTITSPAATRMGMILGTAAYMSPEQARGKPVDKRTDIWAFGCVLYEMLTARRAFGGDEITDTLAFIITKDVDWTALPAATPAGIRTLLRRCLEKDRRRRLPDIGVARIEIDDAVSATVDPAAAPRGGIARPSRLAWAAAALLLIAVLAMLPVTIAHLREAPAAPEAVRLTMSPPDGGFFAGGGAYAPATAVSPDGRQIVFRAQRDGPEQLWIRRLDSVDARPLAGTIGGDLPFWSPDSRFVAFFAGGRLLKIDVATGGIQTLCDAPAGEGGTWNRDGIILFAASASAGLSRVPAAGGRPEPATMLDGAQSSHRWPHFLPDGRRFLFRVQPGNDIHLGSLDSTASRPLFNADSKAVFAAPGYVLFLRRATLFAQRFDLTSEELTGDPLPLASEVIGNVTTGRSGFSVSDGGVLAYRTGSFGRALVTWLDRTGKPLGTVGQPADYRYVALSPDDRRAVVHIHDDSADGGGLWLLDVVRGTTSRFTVGASHDGAAVWSPDGAHIVFESAREKGVSNLYRKPSSGAGTEEVVLQSGVSTSLRDISSDGQSLLYVISEPKTLADLWRLPLSGDRTPVPVLRGPSEEDHGQFSPDDRWIAYASTETGRPEVYVQSAASGEKWQISTSGGVQPTWRRDGRELFYLVPGAETTVMAVDVRGASTFEPGIPNALFRVPFAQAPTGIGLGVINRTYSVTRDGQRFLALMPPPGRLPQPVTVVVNWTAGLPR